MKGLLILTALALSACAPSVLGSAPVDPGGAALTLTSVDGYKLVTFTAGTQPAQSPELTLTGINLSVNDPSCAANLSGQLVCKLATVPAGKAYELPARGVLVVEASYGRSDGKRYTLNTE